MIFLSEFDAHSTLFAIEIAFYRLLQNGVKGQIGVTRGQSVYMTYESLVSDSFDQV